MPNSGRSSYRYASPASKALHPMGALFSAQLLHSIASTSCMSLRVCVFFALRSRSSSGHGPLLHDDDTNQLNQGRIRMLAAIASSYGVGRFFWLLCPPILVQKETRTGRKLQGHHKKSRNRSQSLNQRTYLHALRNVSKCMQRKAHSYIVPTCIHTCAAWPRPGLFYKGLA